MNNVIKKPDAPYQLLEKIPGATITPLVTNEKCCGAAGSFFIEQPKIAKTLRDAQLDAVKEINPDVIATSNFGCGLHLRSGIQKTGKAIEILHPVVLMARQIEMRSPP